MLFFTFVLVVPSTTLCFLDFTLRYLLLKSFVFVFSLIFFTFELHYFINCSILFCFANLFFICIFFISLFLAIRFFYPHFFHLPSRAIFDPRLTDSLYNQISLLPCSISPLFNGEMISWYINVNYFSERFEPRSHFKSFKCRLSLIVRVHVVLNRTVVIDSVWRFDNLCGSHLQSQSELYHVNWRYYTLVIALISQLRRDVTSRLSVKPWCYWLWRLVM